MGYKILISPRAQSEIENIADYYALNSSIAPQLFFSQKLKRLTKSLKKIHFIEFSIKESVL
jgi:hypothetical protein